MNDLSPIVLFVYNRPDHTKRTVDALSANKLANESVLFIYSDAAKNEKAREQVNAVRSYIKTVSGFKSVTIIEREKNGGLASSIIDGVTNVVNQYGKIIVLEDDIVTSPYFLTYMNNALDYYKDNEKVWHISGWNFPIDQQGLGDVFLWRNMECWGWATWKEKWLYFEKNVDKLISTFSPYDKYRFDVNGSCGNWQQVIANKKGKIDTWAIFWSATIYLNHGLCLSPTASLVDNIGFDGSGVHCGATSVYSVNILTKKNINPRVSVIEENELALKRIIHFNRKMKKILPIRVIKKIFRLFKNNVKI
jgi:hypothetical protein